MRFFARVINFLTLGSDNTIRRQIAYYLVLAAVKWLAKYPAPG